MQISMQSLGLMLLYSLGVGVALAVIYDILRITRVMLGVEYGFKSIKHIKEIKLPLLKQKKVYIDSVDGTYEVKKSITKKLSNFMLSLIIALEDILFFAIVAIVIVVFIYHANDGTIRLFPIIGLIIGFMIYYFTLGKLVMLCSEFIVFIIKTVVNYVVYFIKKPIEIIFNWLYNGIILVLIKKLGLYIANKMMKKYSTDEIRKQLALARECSY